MHQFKQLAAKLSSGYTEHESANGSGLIAHANVATKSVSAAKLNCSGNAKAAVGFMIGQLTSASPLPGVKVVAAIEVTQLVGHVDCNPRFGKVGAAPAYYGTRITQPGTYTVTAGPFDLAVNQAYEAGATLVTVSGFTAVEARITEITWDL